MADLEYSAGEVIFKEGYPADDAYIIESGRVEIYKENEDGSEQSIALLGPGQMFGEYGVLDNAPRSACARAVEDTLLQIMAL